MESWGVGESGIKETRTPDKELHVLTDAEIVALPRTAQNGPQWHMRILPALCTGLRSSTLGKPHVEDFDLTRRAISVVDKKTGKLLPDDVMPVVERFLSEQIAPGQVRFFKPQAIRKKKNFDLRKISVSPIRAIYTESPDI